MRAEKENSERLFEEISKGGDFLLPNHMYISVSSDMPHRRDLRIIPRSLRSPTLVGGSFGWSASLPNEIRGSNFGEAPGKLQLVIYAHLTTDKVGPGFSVARWRMPNFEIGPELIEKWADGEIWYYLTEEMFVQINDFRRLVQAEKEARGLKEVAFAYEPIIETTDGQTVGYVPPSQPLPLL